MSNKIFVKKFINEIDSLLKECDFSETTKRMGTRGDILEEKTAALFARYFPNRCGFGKGQIVDCKEGCSREVDVVIFDKDSLPPTAFGEKNKNNERIEGIFPVESCWYAIEIKKTLNNTELKKSIINMAEVNSLSSSTVRIPAKMLFVYSSDLKNSDIKKEFERYKKLDKNWNKNPAINVICIIGVGYLFSQFTKRNEDNSSVLLWRFIRNQSKYYEAVCCIGGMINTISGQNFGNYLFDESNDIEILEEVNL